MTPDNEKLEIINNPAQNRYEVKVGDETAILAYHRRGNSITFIHTQVPETLNGRGIGGKLANFALEEARLNQLKVIPNCPFVASYIQRHPDYLSLLPEGEKERLQKS